MQINEKTTIPLFAVIGAVFTGIAAYGGILLFVASVSTKADLAEAKNIDQDSRYSDLNTEMRELRADISDIKKSATRSESMLEMLVEKKK